VHISAVEQAGLTDLADGQPLEFTLVDRGGRISATNLRIDGEPMAVERAGLPTLNEGDRLSFELEVDRRGKHAAVNLQPIG
jgi:CspA family cold shock protein